MLGGCTRRSVPHASTVRIKLRDSFGRWRRTRLLGRIVGAHRFRPITPKPLPGSLTTSCTVSGETSIPDRRSWLCGGKVTRTVIISNRRITGMSAAVIAELIAEGRAVTEVYFE